ncbi:MAG TPA: hypothetical protein VE959_38710 [Bryobacteraceae bacterium]|nr:hypothetical protein [Bryobacteraceae bacterium]
MGGATAVERMGTARSQIERVCGWLTSPSPETLDRCSGVLESAVAELAGGASWLAHARGNPEAMAEAWHLNRAVKRAGKLLESARQYHARWSRIRGAMTQGYGHQGIVPPPVLPGRISLQG